MFLNNLEFPGLKISLRSSHIPKDSVTFQKENLTPLILLSIKSIILQIKKLMVIWTDSKIGERVDWSFL